MLLWPVLLQVSICELIYLAFLPPFNLILQTRMPKNKEFPDDDPTQVMKKAKVDLQTELGGDNDDPKEGKHDVDDCLKSDGSKSHDSDAAVKMDFCLLYDSEHSSDCSKTNELEYNIDHKLISALTEDLKALDLSSCDEELVIQKVVCFCFANFIPISKIENLISQVVADRKIDLPEESTLFGKYISPIYEETLSKIREAFGDEKIFVSISKSPKTTCTAVIVGVLKPDGIDSTFLINISEKSFYETSAFIIFFTYSLEILWPGTVSLHSEDIFLLLSDDLFHEDTENQLKTLYPKIICHSRPDKNLKSIKSDLKLKYHLFDYIDDLVQALVSKYKKHFVEKSDISLPPEKYIDRIAYYEKNFFSLSEFFNDLMGELDDEDENQIELYRMYYKNQKAHDHLSELSSSYPFIVESLNLIRSKTPLEKSLDTLQSVLSNFSEGSKFERNIYEELYSDVICTPGIPKLMSISNVLYGTSFKFDDFDAEDYDISQYTKQDLEYFRFAPIGGMDFKGCFPRFEQLLRLEPNLTSHKYFHILSVIYCYYESVQKP